MNHGEIGVIDHSKVTKEMRILLPQDVLRVLSIDNGSTLEGVFYRGPGTNTPDPRPRKTLDFALSPIPYRMWPRTGRLRIRVKFDSQALRRIARFLADNKASILHSELSRSAHRFLTWNLVVAFDIDVHDHHFDETTTTFKKTHDALSELASAIVNSCADCLFTEDSDIRFRDSVQSWPLTALAYFYHNSQKMIKSNPGLEWLFEPFPVRCEQGDFVFSSNSPAERLFPAILGHLIPNEAEKRLCVYADISSTDVIMRLSVLPSHDLTRFSELTVEYARNDMPDSSRGFFASVLNAIPDQVTPWKVTNYTMFSARYAERGGVRFLLEDSGASSTSEGELRNRMQEIANTVRLTEFKLTSGKPFTVEADTRPVSAGRSWSELMGERVENIGLRGQTDVFLSYSAADSDVAAELHKQCEDAELSCFMAKKDLAVRSGVPFAEEIRNAILNCREMIVICSPNTQKSEWVTTEWGAAWVLGKLTTPVMFRIGPDDLPERLRALQAVDASRFREAYIVGATERKRIWLSLQRAQLAFRTPSGRF